VGHGEVRRRVATEALGADHGPLDPQFVENRQNVGCPRLWREAAVQGSDVRDTDPACVDQDQPAQRSVQPFEAHVGRMLPLHLVHDRRTVRHEHVTELALAEDGVGDVVAVGGQRVADLVSLGHRIATTSSRRLTDGR
jgi:hypothetical protein